MRRYFIFIIKDTERGSLVYDFLQDAGHLNKKASAKVLFSGKHLMPLLPRDSFYVAILPVLMCSCGDIETLLLSWQEADFNRLEADVEALICALSKCRDLCHFPEDVTSEEGNNVARFLHELLEKLQHYGSYTLDIIVDECLFDELDLESNVELYGALLRACVWHHTSLLSLSENDTSASYAMWLDHLGMQRSRFSSHWLSVWKGCLQVTNGVSFGNVELQVKVPCSESSSLSQHLVQEYDQPSSQVERVFSSELEILDEFHVDTFPMHLLCPVQLKLSSFSDPSSNACRFLQKCGTGETRCFILRLSYWDGCNIYEKQTELSTQAWRKAVQQKSLNRTHIIHRDPTGHLHFVLIQCNSPVVFPLWKNPASVDGTYLSKACLECPNPLSLEGLCTQKLQTVPHAPEADVVEVHGQSKGKCPEAARKYFANADPSEWPERRFLFSKSMRPAQRTGYHTATRNAQELKTISVSAKDILKLFDTSGNSKRSPKEEVKYTECNMKPSITRESLEALSWPYLLHCRYHDLYYNTDTEQLESACNATKARLVADETSTTCDRNLGTSLLTVQGYATRKQSAGGMLEPLQRSPRKKHAVPYALPTVLRRSPRKRVAVVKKQKGASSLPLLKRSPRNPPTALPPLRRSPPKQSKKALSSTHTKKDAYKGVPKKSQTDVPSKNDKLKMKVRIAVTSALESHGVDREHKLFNACGKKLFAICKTFAEDLVGCGQTTRLLQRIANSHAAQVIDFERLKAGIGTM